MDSSPSEFPKPAAAELPERVFCTTREAAETLGVSVGTVQGWVENGWLEAWKTAGGHRRVLRASVHRLLSTRSNSARMPLEPSSGPIPATIPAALSAALPAALPTHAPAPVPARQAGPRRPTVMVVDDDLSILRLYEVQLSRWPGSPLVVCINNPVLALLRIGRSSPEMLIIDLNMPSMDGFAMLHSLRNAPDLGRTLITVVTGMSPAAIEARGGLPGDVDVFGKPVPFQDLQASWTQHRLLEDAPGSRGAAGAGGAADAPAAA